MSQPNLHLEGLRVALEMERRGSNLYRRALKIARDPQIIALLEDLATDEERHYDQFAEMLRAQDALMMTGEENMVAAARAADVFFPGGLMRIAFDGAFDSMQAMLEEAIRAEEDSIAFYQRLIDMTSQEESRAILMQIREEETRHLSALEARREKEMREV